MRVWGFQGLGRVGFRDFEHCRECLPRQGNRGNTGLIHLKKGMNVRSPDCVISGTLVFYS